MPPTFWLQSGANTPSLEALPSSVGNAAAGGPPWSSSSSSSSESSSSESRSRLSPFTWREPSLRSFSPWKRADAASGPPDSSQWAWQGLPWSRAERQRAPPQPGTPSHGHNLAGGSLGTGARGLMGVEKTLLVDTPTRATSGSLRRPPQGTGGDMGWKISQGEVQEGPLAESQPWVPMSQHWQGPQN